jgi:hypothetical protein
VLSAAGLTWDKTTIDREIEAGTAEIRVEIPFRNEGTRPITITELKSSCRCTELVLKSHTIPVGAKAMLTAVYKPGDQVGPQQSSITIKTDEPGTAATYLALRINITPLLTIQPAMVRWDKGGALVSKTITLKRVGSAPLKITAVKPVNDSITAELKPGDTADSWLLVLTPRSTTEFTTTKIKILTEVSGQPVTYSAFAVVR